MGAGFEHRVGTDHAVGADVGQAGDGVLERGALAHGAVDQAAAGADLHALADGGAALEDRAGEEGDVGGQAHGGVDVGGGRVDHRDALGEPLGVGAAAQLGLGVGELGPVVDAVRLVGVVGHDADDPVPGLGQHLDDVGQVELALGVVGAAPCAAPAPAGCAGSRRCRC